MDANGPDQPMFMFTLQMCNEQSVQRVSSNTAIRPKSTLDFVPAGTNILYTALVNGTYSDCFGTRSMCYGACSITTTNSKIRDASLTLVFPTHTVDEDRQQIVGYLVEYAFKTLGLHCVSFVVHDGDRTLIEKYKLVYVALGSTTQHSHADTVVYHVHDSGLVEEGTKRKSNLIDGVWCDEVLLAIVEDE